MDNKSVQYILKENGTKSTLIKKLMVYSFNVGLKFGDIFVSDDGLSCAIMMFPNRRKNVVYSTYQDTKLILNVIGFKNIGKVLKKESNNKKKHPSFDFAHLWYIGVRPENQGNGIGSQLLDEVISYYTSKNLMLYLETSTESNIPFYQKKGFKKFDVNDEYGFNFYYLKN